VGAAEFLQCRASEGEIACRILMYFHPDILFQAVFLSSPGSYRESRNTVGLKMTRAVLADRQCPETSSSSSQRGKAVFYRKISRVGRLLMASRPAGTDLRVGVV